MTPSVLSAQLRETVLDYLRTTFSFSDPGFSEAFFNFLDGPDGIFNGPLRRRPAPFRKVTGKVKLPLQITPPFKHLPAPTGRLEKLQQHSFLRTPI